MSSTATARPPRSSRISARDDTTAAVRDDRAMRPLVALFAFLTASVTVTPGPGTGLATGVGVLAAVLAVLVLSSRWAGFLGVTAPAGCTPAPAESGDGPRQQRDPDGRGRP